ncbi:NADH dehydrogenase subunit 6 [Iris pallida]|uniref:NADH dehydrogenase subunit 6 (Plastid) n=1 Tax=Iris pallida TaxID=29817 RepID=A0AAX6FXE0_IRIPA|nr:NADH dehydrogenase subunit 6 [Iris pallida]
MEKISPFNCRLSNTSENVTRFILTELSICSRHISTLTMARLVISP